MFFLSKNQYFDLKKYKLYFFSFIIFIILSNLQVIYLENKFNNLYNNIQEAKIVATVISERKETTYKASYTIKVENINGDKRFNGTKLIIYTTKNKKLEYGDKIVLYGKYEKANSATNYKAFDYREYLKSKNIYGIFNVEQVEIIKKENLNFFLIFVHNLKIKIKYNLQNILGEKADIVIRNPSSAIYLILKKKL